MIYVFELRLKLFYKHVKSVALCYFPSCDLFHKGGSENFPFQNVITH